MRILLTGPKGNFGTEFLEHTRHDVVQVGREGWNGEGEETFSSVDLIVHAASELHGSVGDSPVSRLDSNVALTARLLESARRFDIPRFIFISSCAVYGESMRTNEESTCQPTSLNGIEKLLNERVVAEFCNANGIEYQIFRVFNMFGGKDNFSILSHLARSIRTRQPFTLFNEGIAQRDFVHVSDVVGVILDLMEKDIPYNVINVGTGVSTRISTLVEIVAERYPSLAVSRQSREEAEYSRADISRLRALSAFQFIGVEAFLRGVVSPSFMV